jgi:serine O-acetyltransferase
MIGANAVVIGKVSIGDNARIGAGCAVATDIPAGATAVSTHPRIIEGDPKRDNTFRKITDK